jgi:hypothetical protein
VFACRKWMVGTVFEDVKQICAHDQGPSDRACPAD